MDIIISNSSSQPIYEQIFSQIKIMILNGELEEGAPLPSMRSLAKELRISVITTKRAYEELELAGFIVTKAGKGSFVAPKNLEIIKEELYRNIDEHLQQAVDAAKIGGITLEELQAIIAILYGDD